MQLFEIYAYQQFVLGAIQNAQKILFGQRSLHDFTDRILLVPALISFLNYMPPFKLLFSMKVLSKMPYLIFYAIDEAEFITI
ncbi:hypothetical protein T06_13638 [Trichinella sp. T6]|nr:hypothetical protein T06_13638 [Trichinella sp. T6]